MKNIKSLIQSTLTNNQNTETTLENISAIQNNLIKNHSNPVFNSKDKNKLMNMYNTLKDLGKSLYKFNSYKMNNMPAEAESEQENVSDMVLKSGISNVKYIWHSENGENTCEKCKSLDGTVYDFEDEVPERPHPNCKCTVEIVENKKDNEQCNCQNLIKQLDELIDQANQLRQIIAIRSSNILEILSYNAWLAVDQTGHWLLEQYSKCDNILGDLTRSFVESRENIYENSDKYYHMKGYCKVPQRESGIVDIIAQSVGLVREIGQGIIDMIIKETTWQEAIKDAREDHRANQTGTIIGRNYPDLDCDSVIQMLWPDILDQVFRK